MSRRDLSQPSFVDALVIECGKSGGFLDRIEQAFDRTAFETLLAAIHASARGAPGYPPLVMATCMIRTKSASPVAYQAMITSGRRRSDW
jgi:hypothetical protein